MRNWLNKVGLRYNYILIILKELDKEHNKMIANIIFIAIIYGILTNVPRTALNTLAYLLFNNYNKYVIL